jgi:hypothetical protein
MKYLPTKLKISKLTKIVLLLCGILFLQSCENKYKDLDLSVYQYRDTRDLVKFVYDASLILKKEGLKSIDYFKNNRKKYFSKNRYLYVFEMDGVNLFHAGMPQLEGQNLIDIADKNGKPIAHLILEALDNPNNPHAWVHYSWWQPGKFFPVPKSSCHFKVTTPEGKELYVGGGVNYPQEEKEFIRIIVDDAAKLIEQNSKDAIKKISDPVSEFNFREVRVFVFTGSGKTLISPVTNNNSVQINLLQCVDETQHKPFIHALKQLELKNSAWEVFLAKNRYDRDLRKMILYIRKVKMDSKEVFVGAASQLPKAP